MKELITMNKNYQTFLGLSVRIICIDKRGTDRPVVGLVTFGDGAEHVWVFTKFGEAITSPDNDLVELLIDV